MQAGGLVQCSAESKDVYLPIQAIVTWCLIYIFSHITWYFTMKTFHYTYLKLYLLDLLLISAFPLYWQTGTVWGVIISHTSTQNWCFRFDVTSAHCHLGICCWQLFPPQKSLSECLRFCWKAFKFSLRAEIHITRRHAGMHTHTLL